MDSVFKSHVGKFGKSVAILGFLTLTTLISHAQSSHSGMPSSLMLRSASNAEQASEDIIREIDDPTTGDRWLLERDSQHPGGPGRMVLVTQAQKSTRQSKVAVESKLAAFEPNASPMLIRSGDHLIVEEHTQRLDLVLEAVALTPARKAEVFPVRLAVGGRVVKVVAVENGRATLASASGVRP